MRRLSWLVVLALICSAFAITAQESGDEGRDNPPALGAPVVAEDGAAPEGALPEGERAQPEFPVENDGGPRLPPPRLPPPRLPAGELAPPAADLLPEPAAEAPRNEQLGGLDDASVSASDRPLTNLDRPVSNDSQDETVDGSAHRPQYPGQPHSYPSPRRDEQAREAIQRRAEFKAAQRARRMETMKWFGYSNSRPSASSVPFMGTYSPTWVGNGSLPSHWSGVNGWSTSVRVEARTR